MAVLSHLAKQKTSFLTAEQKTDDSAGGIPPRKRVFAAPRSPSEVDRLIQNKPRQSIKLV